MSKKQLVLNFSSTGQLMSVDPHKNPQSVMFVCLGNIIRSPLSEGLFRKIVESSSDNLSSKNKIFVDSSAVGNYDLGKPPVDFSQQIALENGFDISNHISKLITKNDFFKFDLIVSLDPSVFAKLNKIKPPNSKSKIIELIPKKYVLNPYNMPRNMFDKMYKEISFGVLELIKKYFPDIYQNYMNNLK